ncbi:hypothetical protein J6590_037597 [Homalodisca vitripennis]|nr:hypothetical protein J6590_037597 [Homalodisca vitripennis]
MFSFSTPKVLVLGICVWSSSRPSSTQSLQIDVAGPGTDHDGLNPGEIIQKNRYTAEMLINSEMSLFQILNDSEHPSESCICSGNMSHWLSHIVEVYQFVVDNSLFSTPDVQQVINSLYRPEVNMTFDSFNFEVAPDTWRCDVTWSRSVSSKNTKHNKHQLGDTERLPNSIKDTPTPKALKTRLKRFLVSQAFYNAGEFLAFDWETAQLEN